ncbi:MAG: hypothetical protein JSU63_17465 [Phycisphaerales bacterium]|nr:MAG: hypothetical protein JSU63_17465 [Phycisphaerales bacterium]
MIRKTIIVVSALLAVGTLVAWGILAFPNAPSTWQSEGGRLFVMRNPDLGTSASASLGTEQWTQVRVNGRYVRHYDYKLGLSVNVRRISVSCSWWTEGLTRSKVKEGRVEYLGFGTARSKPKGCGLHESLYVSRSVWSPVWFPLLLFGAYPTIAYIRGPLRRWRRRRKGLCLGCGYNLTGNVSGVCSECGETV